MFPPTEGLDGRMRTRWNFVDHQTLFMGGTLALAIIGAICADVLAVLLIGEALTVIGVIFANTLGALIGAALGMGVTHMLVDSAQQRPPSA